MECNGIVFRIVENVQVSTISMAWRTQDQVCIPRNGLTEATFINFRI